MVSAARAVKLEIKMAPRYSASPHFHQVMMIPKPKNIK